MTIPEFGSGFASGEPKARLPVIDIARGVAIVAMVIYHTAFDLSLDRLIATDVPGSLGWKLLARATAGAFLLLVGVGLVLAHDRGFDRAAFFRRLALIAGGAALVTGGTWWFAPDDFVFFGILHEIAVASLLALPFLLWSPAWLTALAAALVLAAPWFLEGPAFNAWYLLPLGLSTEPPTSMDYVPVLPWFGVVLAGLVVGRIVVANRAAVARIQPRDPVTRYLKLAGRWSLVIYLVHQPLIVGLLALVTFVMPPGKETARQNFMNQCLAQCPAGADGAPICTPLCACMFDRLYGTPMFSATSPDALTPEQKAEIDGMLNSCADTVAPAPVPAN